MQPDSPPLRELLLAKFEALLDDCDLVADNAAFGQIIHDLDDFLFVEGKKFTKEVLQQKLQERIEHVLDCGKALHGSDCIIASDYHWGGVLAVVWLRERVGDWSKRTEWQYSVPLSTPTSGNYAGNLPTKLGRTRRRRMPQK